MTDTMLAAVYHGPNDLRVEPRPLPVIGPGDVLLKVETATIGGNTDSASNAMGWMALQECLVVLRGEPPQHRVI